MLVALAGELAPLAKKLQRPSSTEATVTIARIGLPIRVAGAAPLMPCVVVTVSSPLGASRLDATAALA